MVGSSFKVSPAVVELPVFLVEVRLGQLPPIVVRAALGPAESHILLGRDVLNSFDLQLYGKRLMLEVSEAS